jgi:hypothetical protein
MDDDRTDVRNAAFPRPSAGVPRSPAHRFREVLAEKVWPAAPVLTSVPRTAILEPRATAADVGLEWGETIPDTTQSNERGTV